MFKFLFCCLAGVDTQLRSGLHADAKPVEQDHRASKLWSQAKSSPAVSGLLYADYHSNFNVPKAMPVTLHEAI